MAQRLDRASKQESGILLRLLIGLMGAMTAAGITPLSSTCKRPFTQRRTQPVLQRTQRPVHYTTVCAPRCIACTAAVEARTALQLGDVAGASCARTCQRGWTQRHCACTGCLWQQGNSQSDICMHRLCGPLLRACKQLPILLPQPAVLLSCNNRRGAVLCGRAGWQTRVSAKHPAT